MNEVQFARRVAVTLDSGLRQLDPNTSAHLSALRHQALARQKLGAVHQTRFAGLVEVLHNGRENFTSWLAAVGLLVALAIGFYWQTQDAFNELEDVDSALLADDLPLGAYLDKGFDTWLQGNSSEQ